MGCYVWDVTTAKQITRLEYLAFPWYRLRIAYPTNVVGRIFCFCFYVFFFAFGFLYFFCLYTEVRVF